MMQIHKGEFADWIKLFRTDDGIELLARVETPKTAMGWNLEFYLLLFVAGFIVTSIWALSPGAKYINGPIIATILFIAGARWLFPHYYRRFKCQELRISFRGDSTLWHVRDWLWRKRSYALPCGDDLVIRVTPHRLGPLADREYARGLPRQPLPEDKRYYQTAQEIIIHAGLRGSRWVSIAEIVYDEFGEQAHALLSAIKQADEDAAKLYRTKQKAQRSTVV